MMLSVCLSVCVLHTAVWPAVPSSTTSSSSDPVACIRRRRDISQQTNGTGTTERPPSLLSHSSTTHDDSTTAIQHQGSPHVKSEHPSPPPMSRDCATSPGLDVTSLSPAHKADRCYSDEAEANTGRSGGRNPCPLGYEIECITPVSHDDQSEAGGRNHDDGHCDDGDVACEGLSGLDVLSCVASTQLHEATTATTTPPPPRRFSILDLPLSQLIDAAADDGGCKTTSKSKSSSPDVISAGYNVPRCSADFVPVSLAESVMSRVIQQHNSASSATAGNHDSSSQPDQRTGDIFTALRVDVGQSTTVHLSSHLI